jgi:ADP-ribosylglycohydrolase
MGACRGGSLAVLSAESARKGASKQEIRAEITERFAYDLRRSLDDIRREYRFDVSCQGSVPESIIAFLESEDFEDAVRNAISLGGDADTMACIAGAIAQAHYGAVPGEIAVEARKRLPVDLLEVLEEFERRFGCSAH